MAATGGIVPGKVETRSLAAWALGVACLLSGCQTPPSSGSSVSAPEAKRGEPREASTASDEKEVTGIPAPNTGFTSVKAGMSMKEVSDLLGFPTDRIGYASDKSRAPSYQGPDRYRFEWLYKEMGRLVFSGPSSYADAGHRLVQIQHNANESGYR